MRQKSKVKRAVFRTALLNEIESSQCDTNDKPVDITKSVRRDPAVMGIDSNEKMHEDPDLYNQIADGLDDIRTGNTRSFNEAITDIRLNRKR